MTAPAATKLDNNDSVGRMAPRPASYTDTDGETQIPASVATPLPVTDLNAARRAGISASASFTPAAAAYSGLDIMDVAKQFAFTFANGDAVPAGSLIRITSVILKIDATALQASEGGYVLQCYSVTPPSAQADNAAWTLASADLPSYRGAIDLGTPVDLGAALFIRTQLTAPVEIKLTTTGLYAELQTTPGFTATAVARQVILQGVVL